LAKRKGKKVGAMCIGILKDSAKSINEAKKKRNVNKTLMVLTESAIIFGISAAIVLFGTGVAAAQLLLPAFSMFALIIVFGLLTGIVIHVATTVLGGRGKYFEGLTAVAYSLVPASIGVLISSVLLFVPYSIGVQVIVFAVAFAMTLGILYRSIKELYGTDMIVSFVSVSVVMLSLILAIYASVGLAAVSTIANSVI
jgi:hypothetical protein